jgi:hypothetical protein
VRDLEADGTLHQRACARRTTGKSKNTFLTSCIQY